VRSYYAYGEQVLAVADGTVVAARDGLPDNIPRTAAGFNTALPISMDNAGGNSIVIDLGDGQFALYAHLKPGSVRVKAGERVRRGDVVARIGNSGDARWPHLHFQVTSNPHILASEGLPYLLDQYRVQVAGKAWETRTREFPFGATRIDFGPAPAKTLK
jgi:murein DD-endopeptidase MepM/ murein hydrolase activator NlpD